MSIQALDALNAYGRTARSIIAGLGEAAPVTAPAEAGSSGFAAYVTPLIEQTGTALRTAETASARQVVGQGDIIDVVTAIGAAETALNTMVAVRDRVVNAYNEIMRMQI
ncbi:flagellar hook-basal body complex protein FliE [Sphingomonas sp. RHCKR7]|uniref:flagellar hook-basal body complex protein FliE n=1 Tax=Sphingomonas folli TaxID=2862497 RepID=UPI001C67AD4D|nr:flagellar hook-basal body complex protein FliE [Sphingomonas folli]MBW6525551.1 flagellar hook-basal body complex protein FliE [Sphingomonas folli]